MLDDLVQEIQEWILSGDQIILMIDLNDDMMNSQASSKIKHLGLIAGITHKHHDNIPFPTCNKGGTRAIDGIYISSIIAVHKGGYLPFHAFPTDHRPLWIGVVISNLCGNKMALIHNPQAR